MEAFKDLSLNVEPHAFERVPEVLERYATGAWRRDPSREEKLEYVSPPSLEGLPLCFFHPETETLAAASLWIAPRRVEGRWYVSNVVPTSKFELTRAEYNALIDDFADVVATPAMTDIDGKVEVSSDQVYLESLMTPDVEKLLRIFSLAANKNTGSSHPYDAARWRTFLIAAHRASAMLDASILARWLIEDEGWPGEQAHDLAVEYEKGRNLLLEYDAVARQRG